MSTESGKATNIVMIHGTRNPESGLESGGPSRRMDNRPEVTSGGSW
jgi:hypothetical protein